MGETKPFRVQLSRAKGWKMPPDTVKVDRTTKWGSPFVVGKDGTREYCVYLYRMLLSGLVCMSGNASITAQKAALAHATDHIAELRGKNLACWCHGSPCHADTLIEIANTGDAS